MKPRANIQLIDSIGGRSIETLTDTHYDALTVKIVCSEYCQVKIAYTLPGSLVN